MLRKVAEDAKIRPGSAFDLTRRDLTFKFIPFDAQRAFEKQKRKTDFFSLFKYPEEAPAVMLFCLRPLPAVRRQGISKARERFRRRLKIFEEVDRL